MKIARDANRKEILTARIQKLPSPLYLCLQKNNSIKITQKLFYVNQGMGYAFLEVVTLNIVFMSIIPFTSKAWCPSAS